MIGYKVVEKEISLKPTETLIIDVFLEPEPILMKELVVSAEKERFKREVDISLRHVEFRDLTTVPGLVEKDLFRAIKVFPGVVAVGDYNSALYVRGGTPDENLVLLDGATIYHPHHIGALFSTFNIDAIKSADLLAGGFPAQYEGRLSSVLNIGTKTCNNKNVAGKWNISLLSSRLFLEGPLPKGSWILALRRTYLDKLVQLIGAAETLPYYFYDVHTKISFDPIGYDHVSLSGFLSNDVIVPSKAKPETGGGGDLYWNNHALSVKWRRIVNPKLFATTLFAKSGYRAKFIYGFGGIELPNYAYNEIDDIGITTDFTYFASQQHSIKFGIDSKKLKFNNTLIPTPTDTALSYHSQSYYSAFYLQDEYQVRIRERTPIVTSAGVRFSHFSSGNYFRLSPRIGIKYLISDDLAVKTAWGLYHQFFSIPIFGDELLERNFVAVTCLPWYSADKNLKPAYGAHYILGIEKWISSDENLSIEAYHKNMYNVLEVRSFPAEEEFISKGTGYARGLELLYKKKNNFISYAYSITKREFDGVNFYPAHDCRHRFNLAWGFPLRKKWSLSTRWIYNTGLPYTGILGYYQYVTFASEIQEVPYDKDLSWESISSREGSFRLPAYHRLDVSVAREFKAFGMNLTAYVQIINLYNHKNYSYVYYDYSKDPPKIERGAPELPILPSIGIMGDF